MSPACLELMHSGSPQPASANAKAVKVPSTSPESHSTDGVTNSTIKGTLGWCKMAKLPKIIPVSDLRAGAATALKSARQTKGPVIITQRGRAAAVLISIEEYEERERERAILKELARGEREIKAGKGHDLDDVLAEADALVNESE